MHTTYLGSPEIDSGCGFGHIACMRLQMAIGMGDASGLYGYSIKAEVRCLMNAVARDGARTKIIILMRESF